MSGELTNIERPDAHPGSRVSRKALAAQYQIGHFLVFFGRNGGSARSPYTILKTTAKSQGGADGMATRSPRSGQGCLEAPPVVQLRVFKVAA
jgi:hypothetical protein